MTNETVNPDIAPKDAEISAPKIEPKLEPKSAPKPAPSPAPQIIRRGGIGFLTAALMSSVAMVGGAYLSLFIQARPDIVQTYGIAAVLPKQQAGLGELNQIRHDLNEIKAHIAKEGEGHKAAAAPAATLPSPTTGAALAPPPNTLQDTTSNPASVAAATAAISLEPIRADMAGLGGRLTAIETRLAALDPTGTGGAIIAALQAEIATLKVVVADLQTKISQTPSPAITFAVISLAEAANRNGAFVPEFEAVRAALPFLPEVAALEPFARKGAPTRALLSEQFTVLAAQVGAIEAQSKQEGGVVGWFRVLFSNLIKVKVKEEANSNSSAMILARAKTKLDAGELQGVIDELKTLTLSPKAVTDWIARANDRLLLEGKIAALRGAIERGMTIQPANQIIAAPTPTAPVTPIITPPIAPQAAPKIGEAK